MDNNNSNRHGRGSNKEMLLFIRAFSPTTQTFFFSHSRLLQQFSLKRNPSTMSVINSQIHAFAGNPIKSKTLKPADPYSSLSSLETLKNQLSDPINAGFLSPGLKVLPFKKGKPLACSYDSIGDLPPNWRLGWVGLVDLKEIFDRFESILNEDLFVYLGSKPEDDVVYWAIDVLGGRERGEGIGLGERRFSFVELRTLMVATDWANGPAMEELAIAGHARALLEWHNVSRFCGHCGEKTVPADAGRRKQCSNELCKKRIYPRVDPVVIMLVIDRENDRALLSRQSRFVPRMWSCLAGFIEPGESLEEAVRRETWEETGIEVGEVIYHSSQPWP
ncbi:hypothetical protein GIB67_025394, partial [Kingdonia uniflora]